MKKKFCLALVLCLVFGIFGGCAASGESYPRFSMSFFGTFDTAVFIIGYAKDETAFARVTDEAKARFTHLHQVFDGYTAYEGVANLYALNQGAAKGPVKVEPELFALLQFCKEKQPTTQGLVNVALGSVLLLWHDFREDAEFNGYGTPPSMEALTEAAKHVSFDDVVLDESAGTVAFLDSGLRLDLGAVAKGYAVELVAQWMLASEMPSFIISAGGNVRAGDPPHDKLRWGVAVQDPDGLALGSAASDTLDTIFLNNASFVTSGDYQRFITIDGVRYHHIISPFTLMPSNFVRSVTIVTEDSGYADLLSTMLFLMPYEEGRAFVDSLPNVDAYWVLPDSSIQYTDGLKGKLKSLGGTSATTSN